MFVIFSQVQNVKRFQIVEVTVKVTQGHRQRHHSICYVLFLNRIPLLLCVYLVQYLLVNLKRACDPECVAFGGKLKYRFIGTIMVTQSY